MSEEAQPKGRLKLALLGVGLVLLVAAGVIYTRLQLSPDPAELALGAKAPDTSTLVDADGKPFDLGALGRTPVFVFYRGHW